jgi:pilus assembly protein CpaF
MIAMAGFDLPVKGLRTQISSAINVIVQARRLTGGKRKIVSVSEITGMEGELIQAHDLFTFEQRGVDENGHAIGFFRVHGIRPKCADRIEHRGLRLPSDLFARRDIETT